MGSGQQEELRQPRLVVAVVQAAASAPFIWRLSAGGGPVGVEMLVEASMRFTLSFNGRRWEQELAGAEPVAAPRDCGACGETGTRVTFDLDPEFFAAGAEIPRSAAGLTADLGLKGAIADLSACGLVMTGLRAAG